MREDVNYPTIRQTARRGPLSEHALRLMQKQNPLLLTLQLKLALLLAVAL